MALPCSICFHPDRQEIDADLLRHADSYSAMACYYGVGRVALQRHERNHLRSSLQRSEALMEQLSADNLLARLSELDRRALRCFSARDGLQC